MLVEIRNWAKYNPRSDVKSTQWLRLENDILIELFDLSSDAKLIWIALLCEASRKQTGRIDISPALVAALVRVSEDFVLRTLADFVDLGFISTNVHARDADVTQTLRERDADVPLRDGTERDGTERNRDSEAEGDGFTPAQFLAVWKEHRGQLPEVRKLNRSREDKIRVRRQEEPDLGYWVALIKRMAASSFLTGKNDRKWRADIDWLIENDKNHVKVSEGKYDNREETSDDPYAGYTLTGGKP